MQMPMPILTENSLLWSKGCLDNQYSKYHTEKCSTETELIQMMRTTDNIIYIRNGSSDRTTDLNIFANNLHELANPCILVTSDGDRLVPSSYEKDVCNKILNHSNIQKWYTQNYDKSILHEKLSYYPIGFDLHTNRWLVDNSIFRKIEHMVKSRIASSTNKRISNKIFSDTHNSITHPERLSLYTIIKKTLIFI